MAIDEGWTKGMKEYKRNPDEESMLGKDTGAKFDQGKNRYDLLAMHAVHELAKNYAGLVVVNKGGIAGYYNSALFHARSFWTGERNYLRGAQHNLIYTARYFFEVLNLEGEIVESSLLECPTEYIESYRHDLIPPRALDEVVKVYTYGTIKYDDNNWRKGMKWGKLYGALERHATKWRWGEIYDDESGLHHLAHAIWQCFALVEYDMFNIGIDDRFHKEETTSNKGSGMVCA